MKKLSNLKKSELIEYITQIRPKADAYDRVCKAVGVKNNLLGFIKNLDMQRVMRCARCNHKIDLDKAERMQRYNEIEHRYIKELNCDRCGNVHIIKDDE